MSAYVVLDIGSRLPLGELWGSSLGFVVIFTAVVFSIGLAARNMAVGAMGAYLTFTYFATEASIQVLEILMYVTLTLVIVGTAMKLWRLEGIQS